LADSEGKGNTTIRRSALLTILLVVFAAGCLKPGFNFNGAAFSINSDMRLDTLNGAAYTYNGRGLFSIGLVGRSLGDSVEYDTLPAGLFFMAVSDQVQNIVLLKRHIIRFGLADTSFSVWGFCCNSSLDAPGGEDGFTVGAVTANAKLNQLIDILADRDVSAALVSVQLAVWEIVDRNRLPQSYIEQFEALPPDTAAPRRLPDPDLGRRLKAGLE
jgi:hypothetical protein